MVSNKDIYKHIKNKRGVHTFLLGMVCLTVIMGCTQTQTDSEIGGTNTTEQEEVITNEEIHWYGDAPDNIFSVNQDIGFDAEPGLYIIEDNLFGIGTKDFRDEGIETFIFTTEQSRTAHLNYTTSKRAIYTDGTYTLEFDYDNKEDIWEGIHHFKQLTDSGEPITMGQSKDDIITNQYPSESNESSETQSDEEESTP